MSLWVRGFDSPRPCCELTQAVSMLFQFECVWFVKAQVEMFRPRFDVFRANSPDLPALQ